MGLIAQLQVWARRRRLAPFVYLGCALVIVLGLVRWEPRTHDAVVGKVGALSPAWTKAEAGQGPGGKDALTGVFEGDDGARPAERPQQEELPPPPPPPRIVEVPYDPGTPSCPEPPRPLVPSTSLGGEADLVYSSVGRLCLASYVEDLDRFLLSSFPPANASLDDPGSLRSQMHRYLHQTFVDLSADSEERAHPPIPRTIHQTNREHGWRPPVKYDSWQPESWPKRNVGWAYEEVSDEEADAWAKQSFTNHEAKPKKGTGKSRLNEPGTTRMLDAWRRTKPVPVMRSDLWRYTKLLLEGGVYADLDAECLKPIDMWSVSGGKAAGGDGEWARGKEQNPPSLIIGIEADIGDRPDWHKWWPRPIQLAQWTMASSPGHPIFVDTLRRILDSLDAIPRRQDGIDASDEQADLTGKKIMSVVEMTGPGPFTDSVLRYIGAMTEGGVRWNHLRSLPIEGLRIGDVLVLSITAFSPGVGHMGSESVDHPGAFVKHGFAGTWKPGLGQ